MSDLISRAEAIKHLYGRLIESANNNVGVREDAGIVFEDIATERIKTWIYEIPTAEVTLCHLDSPCEYQNADIAMPTAQQWIPVSERLPEEDTDVLISYRYKEGEGDTSHVYIDITSYGDMYFGGRKVKGAKHWRQPFEYFTSNYEVIAWMPLPEPWRGGEDETDRS